MTFTVKNSGGRKGANVAQIYVASPGVVDARSEIQLKGFERVELAPGENRRLSVVLPQDDFSRYETSSNTWKVHPGTYSILVGDSVDSTPLTRSYTVKNSD